MLIVEDLLLLLTDDESGAAAADSTKLSYALAGAVLLELSLAGRVDVAGQGEAQKLGRIVIRDSSPTGDSVLDEGLARLSRREGKKPRDVIRHLTSGLRAEVYGRLVARGIVRRDEGKVLGLFPRKRWPTVDATHEQATRRDIVNAALQPGTEVAPRIGALVSLLAAVDKLTVVVIPEESGLTKKEIRRRGKEISAESWAPLAVKQAVEAAQAAVTAAVVASTSAGVVSSS